MCSSDLNKKLEFVLNHRPIAKPQNITIDNNIKEGAIFEYSSQAISFMTDLAISIKKTGGIALIIDYGYAKNEFKNTLQAVKNHQFCDILSKINQGSCDFDLTSLVNFDILRNIAIKQRLETSLITQRDFLLALSIEERRKKLLENKNIAQQKAINSAIDRLIDPCQMGELFKVLICWAK